VAAVVAAFGIVTFFVGGILLVLLAGVIGVVAVVLAVVSVVAAARATSDPGSVRLFATLPAALVLLAGGALGVELVRPEPAPVPAVPEAVRGAGTEPAAIVRAAVASLAAGEDDEVCGLLAATARRPDCGDQPLCTVAAGCEGVPRVRDLSVEETGRRAVARFPPARQRLRGGPAAAGSVGPRGRRLAAAGRAGPGRRVRHDRRAAGAVPRRTSLSPASEWRENVFHFRA
jgi:hypothetical protein